MGLLEQRKEKHRGKTEEYEKKEGKKERRKREEREMA